MQLSHFVPAALTGKRLDAAVKQLFDVSWNDARALVATGKISLDGARVLDGAVIVREGQALARDDKAKKPPRKDELSDDAFVHVDDEVVVVNKPSGLATVPIGNETDTLDARVRRMLAKKSKHRPELGVVHRIDKETSGLVVFTRTWDAKRVLSEQFREHRVHRLYQALAHGTPPPGRIESLLVADRGDGLRGSVRGVAPREAQRAITHVEVKERFLHASSLHCRLETGRTHQIRIHLSEAGCPLIGEKVYIRGFAGPEIRAERLMLHAAELGFTLPGGKELRFVSATPDDMQRLLQRLRDRK